MNPLWYLLIGYFLGQGSVLVAGYIGGLIRECTNELS